MARARRNAAAQGAAKARDPAAAHDPAAVHDPAFSPERWFAARGWTPHAFQREAWARFAAGESGLVHVPTGSGKTYAAYLGPLADIVAERGARPSSGVAVLYITPLRAVARDIELALRLPVEELGLPVTVGARTGDTEARERARQRERLPDVLVTTPESLTLMIAGDRAAEQLAGVRAVIVDEWHELLSSKRGVQVELALARLRALAPAMRTWGLSATIANVEDAARVLVGVGADGGVGADDGVGADGGGGAAGPRASVVHADIPRPIEVRSLLPDSVERFPWAGHLGLTMMKPLLAWLDPAVPTLVFTNTRSQAERWHAAISWERPEWAGVLAIHHGSLEREERERVEAGLKDGSLRIVVATSSLDLGVDFSPVERVVQVGSPKGIARLIQRAGRSGHRPGARCEVLCVPTHALELVEIASARDAVARREIEERHGWRAPLDCLVQHIVTRALGGGFAADALFDEVRTTTAFATLARADFDWCVELALTGGRTLSAYPQYHRIARGDDGRFTIATRRAAQLHRLNIGTISADASISVAMVGGRRLGSIEEGFIARLAPGDAFHFAGQVVEFVRVRDMTAWVRRASRADLVPRWNGARFPLSTALAAAVRRTLDEARRGIFREPETRLAEPILREQMELSALPAPDETLVELCRTRDGSHLFLYPFAGRLVHEGLAVLLALRLARTRPATFAVSMNDYGIELMAEHSGEGEPFDFAPLVGPALFSRDAVVADLLEAVNLGELSRRQFRDIARVAGLVFQKYPGAERSGRQVQAGAGLVFDVLREFDPGNLLLRQAEREVLERQFEGGRLAATLAGLERGPLRITHPRRPTPLGLPLVADRLGTTLSTEGVLARLQAILRGAGAE